MTMKPIDNSQLLAQMRVMAQSAGIHTPATHGDFGPADSSIPIKNTGNFNNLLVKALNNVNSSQNEAMLLARQVESGDDGASLVKAMIASQKSSISFQAALQVRNKVASAYKDIMNMPL